MAEVWQSFAVVKATCRFSRRHPLCRSAHSAGSSTGTEVAKSSNHPRTGDARFLVRTYELEQRAVPCIASECRGDAGWSTGKAGCEARPSAGPRSQHQSLNQTPPHPKTPGPARALFPSASSEAAGKPPASPVARRATIRHVLLDGREFAPGSCDVGWMRMKPITTPRATMHQWIWHDRALPGPLARTVLDQVSRATGCDIQLGANGNNGACHVRIRCASSEQADQTAELLSSFATDSRTRDDIQRERATDIRGRIDAAINAALGRAL